MSTDTQNGGQGAAGRFGAVKEQAESLVQKGVEAVNQSAAQVQENVKATAQSYVDQAKAAAAGELQGVAQFVRNAIPSDNAPPIVSQYANQAAESLEQFAHSLESQDLQSLLAAVNDFARRQPALFLGASVAVGFVIARFLRSKSPQSQYRYGAPASSLYPPQDFQHGHGATSPGLRGDSGAGGSSRSGGGSGSYGSGSSSYGGGQHSGSVQSPGSRSTSYGGTTGSGTSGGSSTQGAGAGIGGGARTPAGGNAGGGSSRGVGGTSSGGSADRSGSPVG